MSRVSHGLFILIVLALLPARAQQSNFRSLLKLDIHKQVQDIRKNQQDIVTYLLESNVRKVKMDYTLLLAQKGYKPEEIQALFASKPYRDLFARVRNNPTLRKRAEDFVTQLTRPYYLEDRAIEKHLKLAAALNQNRQDEAEKAVVALQRKVRQIKTKPAPQLTFWQRLRGRITHFFGLPQ